MPPPSAADLLDALQRSHLLDPAQMAELPRFQARFAEPRALARELFRRGWLTAYQANQLWQGRGAGLVLGSYLLLEPIGAGGMGRVFKARSRKLGKVVALKVLRKERLASSHALPRFEREIRAAARLDHPNVVHAYDAEQAGGTYFLVMEYVDGTDLDRFVRERGPLPVAEACDYVRQAALGLQHAHEHGMTHRDVKPSNLLLGPNGVVKLLDLGLARLERAADDDTDPTLTQEGQVMGTPDYVAPEQALSSRAADIRSDLYSLGGTFYYLLTGQVPIPGGTTLEKLVRLHVETPTPVEQLRPEVPPPVAAIVRRLLAKAPAERYQMPAELVQALADLKVPAPTTAPPKPRRVPAPAEPAAPTDPFEDLVSADTVETTASGSALRQRAARRRWPLAVGAGGAAVLLLLLATAAVLALRRPQTFLAPPENGRLVLRTNVANARVLVKQGNAEVATLGFQAATEAELKPGTYTVQMEGGAGARLSRGQVVLGPGARETVQVTAEPAAPLGGWALVSRPAPLLGVHGWTLTTRSGLGPVRALAHDPRGRWLATSNQDGVVRLLDPRQGDLVRALVGHAAAVRALAWSPDGERLASVDDTGAVRLWQPDSGKPLTAPPTRARGVTWSSDGRTLALVAEPGVVCWDVGTGKVARAPGAPGREQYRGLVPRRQPHRPDSRQGRAAAGGPRGQGARPPGGAPRRGALPGLVPRRQDAGLGQHRPDGARVGRRHGCVDPGAGPPRAAGGGHRRGLVAGRQAARLRGDRGEGGPVAAVPVGRAAAPGRRALAGAQADRRAAAWTGGPGLVARRPLPGRRRRGHFRPLLGGAVRQTAVAGRRIRGGGRPGRLVAGRQAPRLSEPDAGGTVLGVGHRPARRPGVPGRGPPDQPGVVAERPAAGGGPGRRSGGVDRRPLGRPGADPDGPRPGCYHPGLVPRQRHPGLGRHRPDRPPLGHG
jgi:serine/threonine-protein kinase